MADEFVSNMLEVDIEELSFVAAEQPIDDHSVLGPAAEKLCRGLETFRLQSLENSGTIRNSIN